MMYYIVYSTLKLCFIIGNENKRKDDMPRPRKFSREGLDEKGLNRDHVQQDREIMKNVGGCAVLN